MGAAVAHFFVDVSGSLEQQQLVIFALLFVLFCVWTVALSRVWWQRHH